jgi:uncharacterized membrane protein
LILTITILEKDMSNKTKLIIPTAALIAVVGVISLSSTEATAAKKSMEKCYGVAKAGKNDCANVSKTHSCAGQSKMDGDNGEWIYLAKGTCSKLVNGSLSGSAS